MDSQNLDFIQKLRVKFSLNKTLQIFITDQSEKGIFHFSLVADLELTPRT